MSSNMVRGRGSFNVPATDAPALLQRQLSMMMRRAEEPHGETNEVRRFRPSRSK
jgi:hypothetical protein